MLTWALIFRSSLIRKYYTLLKAESELKTLQVRYERMSEKLAKLDSVLLEGESLPSYDENDVTLPIFVQECDTPCAYPVSAPVVRGVHGNYHTGVDLPVPEGTPVFATAKGVVVKVGRDERLGKYVRIRHSKGYESVYAHLERATVKEGDSVKTGSIIGLAGKTGLTTNTHVHYEVYKDGKAVDPSKLVE